ncbi:MAG: C25 family cysteine peptidase, partial [bacterium]
MLRRITWLVCFSLILDYGSGRSTPPSTKIFEVVEIHPSKVVFTLRPFEINVKPFGIENRSYHSVTIPHYGVTTEPGFPMLPAAGALIRMPAAGEVTVTVLESQFEEISGVHVPPTPYIQEDLQTGQVAYQYLENQPIYASDTFWPSRLAVFSSKGRVRGRLIARIQVHPVQYNPLRKTLRVYKTLKIQVAFSEPLPGKAKRGQVKLDLIDKLSQSLFLSPQLGFESELRKPTAAVDRQLKGWYNPQFTYYKLFIDEAGVYSLTYDDLVNAGVSVDLLDLNRLKIIHQGQQIPIWIAGPQGESFSPQNIVYFYGDRHRGSETYYDLYTDTNVYWLTTDGEVGLRYRLVAETNASVNISPFYWETLHVEKEKIFHRANGSSAVDEGEGWIWRYFFDDDREGFDFQVSGRFEAVEVCSIKVRMQGTTKDPVNPDHHVRLSLNNQNIAEAFFDDKDEFIWAVSFPTLLLKEGQNTIELHLVPDTGAQINQIYLDWVEIVYPRVHAALQSELIFRDSNPTGLPTQYSLVNFEDSEVTIFDPIQGKMWQPEAGKISFFRVESAGFDDGNYAKISTEFETLDLKARGHHLVVVYPQTGATETRHFDTFASSNAADDMAKFINGLPEGSIVLAGIVDEGSSSMTEAAYQALESLGSALTRQVEFRDSWALIGWKGAPIGTVAETLSKRFDGPAAVADTFRNEQAFRFSGSFEDTASANTFYVGFSSQGVKKVQGIEKDQSSDLRASSNGADYLILTHQDFKREAERLASYRRDHNGFRTVVVDVQDIYDEFNDGIMNPQAIKDFITYAYQNWQAPAPWFVLLFGDASWDPKKLLTGATKTNFVPSYGILVADNWYVTLDGPDDILPDMFIGRIPVETTDQAAVVVDKIMAYERLPFAAWNKEFVFLNGGINSTEQSIFLSQANALTAEHIEPPPFNGKVTMFNKTTNEAITQSLRRKVSNKINQGVLWVNFLGHAGSTVWDIDAGQPDEWQNREAFPFMTGMSC